jgi:hypothetical protein
VLFSSHTVGRQEIKYGRPIKHKEIRKNEGLVQADRVGGGN